LNLFVVNIVRLDLCIAGHQRERERQREREDNGYFRGEECWNRGTGNSRSLTAFAFKLGTY